MFVDCPPKVPTVDLYNEIKLAREEIPQVADDIERLKRQIDADIMARKATHSAQSFREFFRDFKDYIREADASELIDDDGDTAARLRRCQNSTLGLIRVIDEQKSNRSVVAQLRAALVALDEEIMSTRETLSAHDAPIKAKNLAGMSLLSFDQALGLVSELEDNGSSNS